jgi:hypothetical protein
MAGSIIMQHRAWATGDVIGRPTRPRSSETDSRLVAAMASRDRATPGGAVELRPARPEDADAMRQLARAAYQHYLPASAASRPDDQMPDALAA